MTRLRLLYFLSIPLMFLLGFALAWFVGHYVGLPVAIAAVVALLSLVGLVVVLRWPYGT